MPTTLGTLDDDNGVPPSRLRQGFTKLWTAAELSKLKRLLASGLFIADAAEALDRSYRSVYEKVQRHGLDYQRDFNTTARPRRKPQRY